VLLVQCCMCCRSRLQRATQKPATAAALVLTTIAPQLSDSPSRPGRSASIVHTASSGDKQYLTDLTGPGW
jgi:hypothetical protein